MIDAEDLTETEVEDDNDDGPTGVIIALLPCVEDCQRMAVGTEGPEDIHLTLGYFGDAEDLDDEMIERLRSKAAAISASVPTFTTPVNGNAKIGDHDAQVMLVEHKKIAEARDLAMLGMEPSDDEHPHYIPHVTLSYEPLDWSTYDLPSEIRFDRVAVMIAGDKQEYPLKSPVTAALEFAIDPVESSEDLHRATITKDTAWYYERRRKALIAAGKWNPLLHPRGHDGKFIKVGGWVRWLGDDFRWKRGQVTSIDSTGQIHVKALDRDGDLPKGEMYTFPSKELYAVPATKALLNAPDISKQQDKGFTKYKGQGGSNPGGFFQKTPDQVPGAGPTKTDKMIAAMAPDEKGYVDSPEAQKMYDDFKGSLTVFPDDVEAHVSQDGFPGGPKPGEYTATWSVSDWTTDIVDDTQDGSFGVLHIPLKRTVTGWIAEQPEEPSLDGPVGAQIGLDIKAASSAWLAQNQIKPVSKELFAAATPIEIPGSAADLEPDKYYVKKSKSMQHAANEQLANDLYELAGVFVPEVTRGKDDPQTILSKIEPGERKSLSDATPDELDELRENLVIDAWLANWDVVGLGFDNVVIVDGHPQRIDAGGSLLYRAQGGPKGAHFGPNVGELKTLRDAKMNPQSAKIFGPTSDYELKQGAERLAAIKPSDIQKAVDAQFGYDTGQADALTSILLARRTDLLKQVGVPDPYEKAAPVSTGPKPVEPAAVVKTKTTNQLVPGDVVKLGDGTPATIVSLKKQVGSSVGAYDIELKVNDATGIQSFFPDKSWDVVEEGKPLPPAPGTKTPSVPKEGTAASVKVGDFIKFGGSSYDTTAVYRVDKVVDIVSSHNEDMVALDLTAMDGTVPGQTYKNYKVHTDEKISKVSLTTPAQKDAVHEKAAAAADAEVLETGTQSDIIKVANGTELDITKLNKNLKVAGKVKIGNLKEGDAVFIPAGTDTSANSQRGAGMMAVVTDVQEKTNSVNGKAYSSIKLETAGEGTIELSTYVSHYAPKADGDKIAKQEVVLLEELPEWLGGVKAPSFKTDGTLMIDGHVVGTWSPKNWSHNWQAKIDGKYTASGKPVIFSSYAKVDLKPQIFGQVLLPPPSVATPAPVPKKKGALDLEEALAKESAGTLSNGLPAVVGMRVTHTSGFEGTITGWPNQEKYPGSMYVKLQDGTKKIYNVSKLVGHVKPKKPAYDGPLTADGKEPKPGQKIKTGKSGLTATLLKVNPKNQYVTALLSDGTKKTTTLATTYVLEDVDDDGVPDTETTSGSIVAIAKGVAVDPTAAGDGSVPNQDETARAIWYSSGLRKFMKDGNAPYYGMPVTYKGKGGYTVVGWQKKSAGNPNLVKILSPDGEVTNRSVTQLEFDDKSPLADLPKVGKVSVTTVGSSYSGDPKLSDLNIDELPAGALILQQNARGGPGGSTSNASIMVAMPNGDVYMASSYDKKYTKQAIGGEYGGQNFLKDSLASAVDYWGGGSWKIIAVADPESNNVLVGNTGYLKPEMTKPSIVDAGLLSESDTVEIALAKKLNAEVEQINTGAGLPAFAAPTGTLMPPPQPKTVVQKKNLPKVVSGQGKHLSKKQVVKGAPTVKDAMLSVIKPESDKEFRGAIQFSASDGDSIDGQQLRMQQVIGPDGKEYVETRFKLREPAADAVGSELITTGGAKGAWTVKETKTADKLAVGDAISVRTGSVKGVDGAKQLKPASDSAPNARILATEKIEPIAGSQFERYRVKVALSDGSTGEMDVELRPSGIHVYEWDPNKAAVGVALTLSDEAAASGWKRVGKAGSYKTTMKDGKKTYVSSDVVQANGHGHMLVKGFEDGTKVTFNYVHPSESKGYSGWSTPRWGASINEVVVLTPVDDPDKMQESLAEAMQSVGLTPDKLEPPTVEELTTMTLRKVAWQLDPQWKPGNDYAEITADPKNPATQALLKQVGKQLDLGRDATLADFSVYTNPDGRMYVGYGPELVSAIVKKQGTKSYYHHSSGGTDRLVSIFGSPASSGLMATDERWSRGIHTSGMSSSADMNIGSGDRVYLRASKSKTPNTGGVAFVVAPEVIARNADVYANAGDEFGRRTGQWLAGYSGGGNETMYKGYIAPEDISYVVVPSQTRAVLLQQLKAQGTTTYGGRPIEEVIVSSPPSGGATVPSSSQPGVSLADLGVPV